MKQETGKTNHHSVNSLSIQVSLSGHSFLYSIINATQYEETFIIDDLLNYVTKNNVSDIRLFISQQKYVTIPVELYRKDDIMLYLSTKSIPYSTSINCDIAEDVVVIYPMLEGLEDEIHLLRTKCNINIFNSLTHILFLLNETVGNAIVFSYIGNVMNIVANKDAELRFIEIFNVDDENSIVDLVDIVVQEHDLNDCKIVWIGKLSENSTRILQSCYNTN